MLGGLHGDDLASSRSLGVVQAGAAWSARGPQGNTSGAESRHASLAHVLPLDPRSRERSVQRTEDHSVHQGLFFLTALSLDLSLLSEVQMPTPQTFDWGKLRSLFLSYRFGTPRAVSQLFFQLRNITFLDVTLTTRPKKEMTLEGHYVLPNLDTLITDEHPLLFYLTTPRLRVLELSCEVGTESIQLFLVRCECIIQSLTIETFVARDGIADLVARMPSLRSLTVQCALSVVAVHLVQQPRRDGHDKLCPALSEFSVGYFNDDPPLVLLESIAELLESRADGQAYLQP